MKVALVHDYLNQYGGAEQVLKTLCKMFPTAPIFTLFYSPKIIQEFRNHPIVHSPLQRIPGITRYHRLFPLFMPYAVEQFDLSEYDLIISDSESFGKGVLPSSHTIHISYCHTPARFLWDGSQQYLASSPFPLLVKPFIPFALTYLRTWDYEASKRVDHFLANSQFIARRIKKYYRRDATVIYPPVEVKELSRKHGERQEHYLLLMRLQPYKRPDIVIRAFNELGLPLHVVGDGPLLSSLKRIAHKNIQFFASIPHRWVGEYYAKARALIFPQEEDFGISAVEACATGTPVIAYRGGGALEIIKEGVNGIFFNEQTPEALMKAISIFQKMKFRDRIIKDSAKKFNEEIFKVKMVEFIDSLSK